MSLLPGGTPQTPGIALGSNLVFFRMTSKNENVKSHTGELRAVFTGSSYYVLIGVKFGLMV
jgi:hypothetical protein